MVDRDQRAALPRGLEMGDDPFHVVGHEGFIVGLFTADEVGMRLEKGVFDTGDDGHAG